MFDATQRRPPPRLASGTGPNAYSGRRPRVLIVDDVPVDARALSWMLNGMGMERQIVGSGEEALRCVQCGAAQGSPYDLICLDWRMPGMDGLETARRIRLLSPAASSPTIILVTGHSQFRYSQVAAQKQEQDPSATNQLLYGVLFKPPGPGSTPGNHRRPNGKLGGDSGKFHVPIRFDTGCWAIWCAAKFGQ